MEINKKTLEEMEIFLNDRDCYIEKTIDNHNILLLDSSRVEDEFEEKFNITLEKFVEVELGEDGFIGYNDEWVMCEECYKYFNIYDHKHTLLEYSICESCVINNEDLQDDYINQITNNPERANNILDAETLKEKGFNRLNDIYNNGLYKNMDDDPITIFNNLRSNNTDILFNIISSNPFSVTFEVWVKNN